MSVFHPCSLQGHSPPKESENKISKISGGFKTKSDKFNKPTSPQLVGDGREMGGDAKSKTRNERQTSSFKMQSPPWNTRTRRWRATGGTPVVPVAGRPPPPTGGAALVAARGRAVAPRLPICHSATNAGSAEYWSSWSMACSLILRELLLRRRRVAAFRLVKNRMKNPPQWQSSLYARSPQSRRRWKTLFCIEIEIVHVKQRSVLRGRT